MGQRIALIGHSGSGKTACLEALGGKRKVADMDCVLNVTGASESDEQASEMLKGFAVVSRDRDPGSVNDLE